MSFSRMRLREYMARYGYVPFDTPIIEPAGLFLTKAGDQIIERLLLFERSGAQFTLRPEFTASVARHYIERGEHDIVRWQFEGPIFEDTPQSGAHHFQRTSMGAELIGMAGPVADSEIIGMAVQGLHQQGLDDWQLVIGHVGLTRQILNSFSLDERTQRFLLNQRGLLRVEDYRIDPVIEKLDAYLALEVSSSMSSVESLETTAQVVTQLLNGNTERPLGGRSREDIARRIVQKQKQAAHREQIIAAVEFLAQWMSIRGPIDAVKERIEVLLPATDDQAYLIWQEWMGAVEMLFSYGIEHDRVLLQPDLARTWDYYTGIVFSLQTQEHLLAGGGRYDELTRLIGGMENTPAVGFVYYVDEIEALLGVDINHGLPTVQLIFEKRVGQAATWWANALRRLFIPVVLLPEAQQPGEVISVEIDGTAHYQGTSYTQDQLDALFAELRSRLKGGQ